MSSRRGGRDRASRLIVLPIPGLHVRVNVKGDDPNCTGMLELTMPSHHSVIAWHTLPSFSHGATDAGARRIADAVQELVLSAIDVAPRRHARQGKPVRHHKLDAWVPDDERAKAYEVAAGRGMSVSELMRRGLALAIEEGAKADEYMNGPGSERHVRQALRLLAACNPDDCPDDIVADAHVGSAYDVMRGLRKVLSATSETNVLAAQLLGLGWMFEDPAEEPRKPTTGRRSGGIAARRITGGSVDLRTP